MAKGSAPPRKTRSSTSKGKRCDSPHFVYCPTLTFYDSLVDDLQSLGRFHLPRAQNSAYIRAAYTHTVVLTSNSVLSSKKTAQSSSFHDKAEVKEEAEVGTSYKTQRSPYVAFFHLQHRY